MHTRHELTRGERSVKVEMLSITLQFTVGFTSSIWFCRHGNDSGEQMSVCFLKFYKQGN